MSKTSEVLKRNHNHPVVFRQGTAKRPRYSWYSLFRPAFMTGKTFQRILMQRAYGTFRQGKESDMEFYGFLAQRINDVCGQLYPGEEFMELEPWHVEEWLKGGLYRKRAVSESASA